MATTAITADLLAVNTRSPNYATFATGGSGNGIVATSTADGWIVSPPSGIQFDERLVVILGADASGGTVTFKAGTRFPAQRADLGDLVITLGASEGRVVHLEVSRFMTSTGTIVAIPSTTAIALTAVVTAKAP